MMINFSSTIVLLISFPIYTLGRSLYLETAPLFRSNSLQYHSSPEHFEKVTEKFARHILNQAPAGSVTPASTTSSIQTFIVKNGDKCHHRCHDKLAKRFGDHRYEIISADVGVLTTSLQELREYRHSLSALSTATTELIDFVPLYSEMKISSEVRDIMKNLVNYCKSTGNAPIKLIFLAPGLSTDEYNRFQTTILSQINRYNGVIKYETSFVHNQFVEQTRFRGMITINDCALTESFVTFLSNQPEITWIEQNFPIIGHNRWSNGVCDSGMTEITPLDDWNITGDGEVIAVSDTGIDMKNCYFYDPNHNPPYDTVNLNHRKVVYYVTYGDRYDSTEGHGTHVAASAAGLAYENYGDYKRFRGMASTAKIAFADLLNGDSTTGSISIPNIGINAMFTELAKSGAKIFTNSWGTSSNSYDSNAQQVDIYMRNNPDALVLFSAGNSGKNGQNSVNSPSTNKNGISVGASLNDRASWQAVLNSDNPSSVYNKDSVAYFSSQGPTADNRLKPDILAPGYFIYSAKGRYNASSVHCDIQGLSGTSMAAPTMAGFAAKIRQYYRFGYYPSGKANASDGFTPSGALLKATLIHSGQRANYLVEDASKFSTLTTYPSTIQGYGRIQLNAVLNFAESSRNPITMFVVGGATSNDAHYAEFTITGESDQYTFTTNSDSSQAPIRITFCYTDAAGSPSSSNPLFNVLSVSVSASTGGSFTPYLVSGTVKSNVQVIDITSPTASTTYTVNINADTITRTPQPYALVITGSLTYLNATGSSSESNTDSGSPSISYDTTNYIIVMAVACFVLFAAYYHFYTVSKENLLLDPRNYGNYDPLEFDDPEVAKKNTTLFQRLFTKSKRPANQRR